MAMLPELFEGLVHSTGDVGFLVVQALLLRPLIDALADGDVWRASSWGAAFVGTNLLRMIAIHRMFFVNYRTG